MSQVIPFYNQNYYLIEETRKQFHYVSEYGDIKNKAHLYFTFVNNVLMLSLLNFEDGKIKNQINVHKNETGKITIECISKEFDQIMANQIEQPIPYLVNAYGIYDNDESSFELQLYREGRTCPFCFLKDQVGLYDFYDKEDNEVFTITSQSIAYFYGMFSFLPMILNSFEEEYNAIEKVFEK